MDRGRTCGWELTLESAITTVPLRIYTLKKKSKARGFAQTTSLYLFFKCTKQVAHL